MYFISFFAFIEMEKILFFFCKHVKIVLPFSRFYKNYRELQVVEYNIYNTTTNNWVKNTTTKPILESQRERWEDSTKLLRACDTRCGRQFWGDIEHHESQAGNFDLPKLSSKTFHIPRNSDDGHQALTQNEAESCSRRQ